MPVSSWYFPTYATSSGTNAWDTPDNVMADDAAYSFASCSRDLDYPYGYSEDHTAWLYMLAFTGLTTGVSAGDRIDGIEIEISAKVDRADLDTVLKARFGGGDDQTSAPLTTSWATYTLGGPTNIVGIDWYYANALNISAYGALVRAVPTVGFGTAVVSIQYVKVRIYSTDTHCDPITFTPAVNVVPGEWAYSDVITIAGMPGGWAAPVSFDADNSWGFLTEASVCKNNDGKWLTIVDPAVTTTVNGDTWQIRRRFFYARPDDSDTGTFYDLNVFGITGRFTVTTTAPDRTPTPVVPMFEDRLELPRSSTVHLKTLRIDGVNAGAVGGDAFADGMYVWFPLALNGTTHIRITSGDNSPLPAGTVSAFYDDTYIWDVYEGDYVEYWLDTVATFNTQANPAVYLGAQTPFSFYATTVVADTLPTQVYFTTPAPVVVATVTTSNLVTIAGINDTANVTFSTSGGTSHEYQKNGGAWTAVGATTVANGDTMKLRMTSSAAGSTSSNITMKIGTMHATFCIVTTAGDVTPDAFTFTDVTDAIPGLLYTSNAQVLAGTTAAQAMLATVSPGFEIRVGAGAWTASSLSVVAGDSITIRGYAPLQAGTVATCVVTIGGTQDTWTITSRKAHAFWD